MSDRPKNYHTVSFSGYRQDCNSQADDIHATLEEKMSNNVEYVCSHVCIVSNSVECLYIHT